MRVDFNVPIKDQKITNDARIKASLASIQYLLEKKVPIILMSHLGKPKGKKDPLLSLAPCAKRLSDLLKKPVQMADDCIGQKTEKMAHDLKPQEILLLENLRFYEAEEHPEKDASFAKNLAKLGSCYVNDAFGTAHRAHTSTVMVPKEFPGKAAMGFLMEKEIQELSSLFQNPKRPFYAILAGAKLSSKLGVIQKLLEKVDRLFLAGAMIFPFLQKKGISIGSSKTDEKANLPNLSEEKLVFPIDLVIAKEISSQSETKTVSLKDGIPEGWQGLDIGEKTIESWRKELQKANTLFWNGPVGVFETPPFDKGTQAIAKAIAGSQAKTIAGGGDSLAAIENLGLSNQFSYLSTGGGASLEFLEKNHLPGIDALTKKH